MFIFAYQVTSQKIIIFFNNYQKEEKNSSQDVRPDYFQEWKVYVQEIISTQKIQVHAEGKQTKLQGETAVVEEKSRS